MTWVTLPPDAWSTTSTGTVASDGGVYTVSSPTVPRALPCRIAAKIRSADWSIRRIPRFEGSG